MKRAVDDKTILDKFAEDFARIVEKHARYVICSGFVSIAHGRSRGTEDIDMIMEDISKDKFLMLHEELVKGGFVCIQSENPERVYEDYLKKGDSVRYVIDEEGFFPPEMEIKFAKDEIDREQINSRQKFELTGLDVYFSPIEANIAFKEEALKSPKDLEDAKHLRLIYQGKIDESEIERTKEKIRRFRLNERQNAFRAG